MHTFSSFTAQREPLLFALDGSRTFGEQVAECFGILLSPHEEREFEDGEHKARPLLNVREHDVFVIHSLYADKKQSSNDKLCRLLFFIGALKDASAGRVTAVGVDTVVTMDVHNLAAYQNAFRCRTEHLEAGPLFAAHFASMLKGEDIVVVSPDEGASSERSNSGSVSRMKPVPRSVRHSPRNTAATTSSAATCWRETSQAGMRSSSTI